MPSYRAALPIYVRLQEYPREAQVLQNSALMEYELGQFREARRDYVRALEVNGQGPDSSLRGDILNNMALVEYASGKLDLALEHYSEARELHQRLQNPLQVARSLHGLGIVYYAAGDRTQALDYFTQALAMRSATQDARGRTATLRAMASVLSDLGRQSEAIALRQEALLLAVAPALRVRLESQQARDLASNGQREQAAALANQAVDESTKAPHSFRALALTTRAQLELDLGDGLTAQRDLAEALRILKGSEAAREEFSTLVVAARAASARGARTQALAFLEQAMDLAEQMRLDTANPELRAGVWEGLRSAFDMEIDLLSEDAGLAPGTSRGSAALDSLAVAERSRARSLSDYWHRGDPAVGSAADQRLEALYTQIADRRSQLEVRLERSGEADPRTQALKADIAGLRRQADSLHRIATGASAPGPGTRKEFRHELQQLAERIPADTAVVEYWLGATAAWAWIITKSGVQEVQLGPSSELQSSARALHLALRDLARAPGDRVELLSKLSAALIGKLPQEVLRSRALIVIPDGALHYVPFAVLPVSASPGSSPLASEHVIVIAPSLSATAWRTRTSPATSRVLIVSDPVYSRGDPRVIGAPVTPAGASPSGLREKFERLPATALEAAAISQDFEPTQVERLDSFDASRSAFLAHDLSRYRIIHLAAHAVTDTQAPQLSALIFSLRDRAGASMPGELYAGELSLQHLNADLVVLSACDTALGREVMGEGLLGLRYAAHAAGARAVIASLWPVSERTTLELMSAFYGHYIHDREPPAQALATAMREMREKYADPALWGAFEISAVGADAALVAQRNH
jgi:CHAT domain-containing protein/Tfp pilus assembly protein PilF